MMGRSIARAVSRPALWLALLLVGCPGPRHPREPAAQPLTLTIGRDGGSLRGVAATAMHVVSAVTVEARTVVEARRGETLAWSADVPGSGGPLTVSGPLVIATVTATGDAGGGPVRGEPGGAVVALDAATGAKRWRVAFDASEWVVLAAIAAAPDGVIVGGSFSGSLRATTHVVASGGRSDGFVAKILASGQVAWLVRMGAGGADAVQGVAVRGDRIAIAGTFAAGADVLGAPLLPFDEKSPYPDGFVAELDAKGARRWVATFGGKLAESVVGVAIDESGRVVVAANARDVVHVGGADLVTQGPADGLVGWWTAAGAAEHAVLIGGAEFDGLRAITAHGDRIVVGGFYSGTMTLGDRAITAGGGDDAFLAALDGQGTIRETWQVSGQGREEISALTTTAGGFVAGISHTAASTIDGTAVAAPKDPMSGAVVIVRPLR